ncbi:universal stress protein [Marivita sp. GX14005]|uniref:universal stress protein n=1 Tax=Marivita sp. GX14005 TaxID=2942276 RepID=UPI00201A0C87|nr:universal stress protein [Marivita sp. GX14005]MCL3881887.1 universal stress protein [Marivita sp. GX14005]
MFDIILVPVDVSLPGETEKLLNHAKLFAEKWGSEVHVVSVIPNVGMPIVGSYLDEGFERTALVETEAELKRQIDAAGVTGQAHVLKGTVYDRVIALANSLDVDLILIGAHQPQLKDYLLGSNAARLVRHSAKSVLVLRD